MFTAATKSSAHVPRRNAQPEQLFLGFRVLRERVSTFIEYANPAARTDNTTMRTSP